MGIFDVPINELIIRTAEKLKSIPEISPPDWAQFVKTGVYKERPPVQKDWWFIRAAAILLKIQRIGPIGVSKLRTKFGGKKNRGVRPEHFFKGSGSIVRKILQQLEKAGLAKKAEKGIHKGRVISPKGSSLLDKVSAEIMKEMNIVIPKKPAEQLKIAQPKKAKKKKKKTAKRAPRKRVSKKKPATEEMPAENAVQEPESKEITPAETAVQEPESKKIKPAEKAAEAKEE